MAELNANTPYVSGYIRNKFISKDDKEGVTPGYIFGVKSQINNPLLFHFQSSFGAVFWNQPISAFCHKEDYELLSEDETTRLSLLESWDCQSNAIAVTTFRFLQYRTVDVFCRDKEWRKGVYHFTIDDHEGDANFLNVGYAGDMDSKCFHFIELEGGNFCVQPNNLLRWHNPDFIIPYDKENPPKLKVDSVRRSSEDLDRSYGNSPYFFYGGDSEEIKQ